MTMHTGPTAFTRFRTASPFDFRLSTFEDGHRQRPDGSKDYYTRNRVLLRQIVQPGSPARVMGTNVRLKTLSKDRWGRDYARQRVLFILPSDALGDCVGVVLFLRAFRRRYPHAAITVANTGAATDIFAAEAGVRVLPLLISTNELERHHPVIDLGEVDGWDSVTTQPVDVETVLLRLFGLDPEPGLLRPIGAQPRIAILPMASSPLRTLPPSVTIALAHGLAGRGRLSVVVNAYQGVTAAYERALRLGGLADGAELLPGFATTRGLLDFLAAQDFVVVADSGPAHLTKLFGTRGAAVYTSADGAVLQGRHGNLARWQVPFKGPHCEAPCGLAKLRALDDGRVGCMGSLNVSSADLSNLPGQAQPALAAHLILDDPVPCVRALMDGKGELAAFAVRSLDGAAGTE